MDDLGDSVAEEDSSSSDEDGSTMQRVKGHKVLATPAVRRVASENNVRLYLLPS